MRKLFNKNYSTVALFALFSSPSTAGSLSTSLITSLPRKRSNFWTERIDSTSKPLFLDSVRSGYRGVAARSARLASTTISEQSETETEQVVEIREEMTAGYKLAVLRDRMKELDLDVYLIPTDDPHLSEYVPKAYMRRAFLTGFTGSAGTAVVTQHKALLWTDSRYWNEAGLQLDSEHWTMQKAGLPSTPTISKWLAETAAEHYRTENKPLKIGVDPYVHPASFAKDVEKAMTEVTAASFDDSDVVLGTLVTNHNNLIDPIWGEERPELPTSPFRVHPLEYSGKSVADKLTSIRREMEKKHATMAVFSTLDDVAYLFNLRATGDIETCPVGIAYASLTLNECTLYCDPAKLRDDDVKAHLESSGVTTKRYNDIIDDMKAHCSCNSSEIPKPKIWLDKSRSNLALASIIPESSLIDSQNAITPMKACKNMAEIAGMREAHIVDGVAMANFMAWLEDQIVTKGRSVDEVEIDEVLTSYRAAQPGFIECSFPTIAGVGPNAAIIHYRAQRNEIMRYLDRQAPILIDSGGQYLYGTTDVTRTWSFQETPDPKFKEFYTRVLKGHIGVDQMVFPENTPGFVLDVFARRFLWSISKDYGHGTGHGVGAALNVHEGPMSISPRFSNLEGLKKGMVVSNEPGYYEDGAFGVRIENLLEIQYVNPDHDVDVESINGSEVKSTEKKYLKFGRLTQIPIQKSLLDLSIMTNEELNWLDAYHEEVFSKVGPRLEEGSPAKAWLTKSCEKIDRQI